MSTATAAKNLAGIAALHPKFEALPVLAGPTTDRQFNTLRPIIIPFACWRMDDVRFEFDSSFVLPSAAKELAELSKLVERNTHGGVKPPASVFGHADPVGDDEYNKQLSGRRAAAIYGVLTHDGALWEKLFSQPFGNDNWNAKQVVATCLSALGFAGPQGIRTFQAQNGLAADGVVGPQTRPAVFQAYMQKLFPNKLEKTDFLGKGRDPEGKADFQGCSEFNPILLFSKQEKQQLDQNHVERNRENAPNRRVVVFLFRPGIELDPQKWPCPRAGENSAGCRKRFFTDGEQKRTNGDSRRTFDEDGDTFACRFYQRLSDRSPCERPSVIERMDDPEPRGDAEENDNLVPIDLSEFDTPEPPKERLSLVESKFREKKTAKPVLPTFGHLPDPIATKHPELAQAITDLIDGKFADKGESDGKGGFKDATLQSLLKAHAEWWLDANDKAVDQTPFATLTSAALAQVPKTGGSGDSAGKAVREFPLWVNVFQVRLILSDAAEFSKKFPQEHRATLKLLQAFLNAFTKKLNGSLHSSLEEFYRHVGKTEASKGGASNGQAVPYGGFAGAADWCTGASTNALTRGLLARGLRFKPGQFQVQTPSEDYNAELTKQVNAFIKWQTKVEKGRTVNLTRQAPGDNEPLKPGDIIFVVNGGKQGPLSGHCATVIHEDTSIAAAGDPAKGVPQILSRVLYVSGNAGGPGNFVGAVRVEEVTREMAPEGYKYGLVAEIGNDFAAGIQAHPKTGAPRILVAAENSVLHNLPVNREDPRFKLGVHAPKEPGHSWVVRITHASRLNQFDAAGNSTNPDIIAGTRTEDFKKNKPTDFI